MEKNPTRFEASRESVLIHAELTALASEMNRVSSMWAQYPVFSNAAAIADALHAVCAVASVVEMRVLKYEEAAFPG